MANLMNQLFDDARAYNLDYGHTLNLDIDSHCDLVGSDMKLPVFSNLITNAIKYTERRHYYDYWHEDGDHAYFTVQDNGIGINPKNIYPV